MAAIQAPASGGDHVFAIGSVGGDTTVGWTVFDSDPFNAHSTVYAGAPFSTNHTITADLPFGGPTIDLDEGDGDSDGATMVFVILNSILVFDGTSATKASLPDPLAIAWTGDHIEVAALRTDSAGVGLSEVRFTPDLVVSSPPPIFPDTVRADGSGPQPHDAAFVAADARRALFGYFYVAGGIGHQALAQVCF